MAPVSGCKRIIIFDDQMSHARINSVQTDDSAGHFLFLLLHSNRSDSCTAITTAMIRFPPVSSSSAVLTATCQDLKALKDGRYGNILWQLFHFFDPCRISSRLSALVSA